ncbi:MAG: hypothetical protein KGL91_09180 [Xanthomonadaceae bacterium]|nr:hypothetical protein [Xanthomonadaceae bacterium]
MPRLSAHNGWQARVVEASMEYRVRLQAPALALEPVEAAIQNMDPAAFVDRDPADGELRVTAWLKEAELATVLAEAGFPASSIVLQPSVCCGDCSG